MNLGVSNLAKDSERVDLPDCACLSLSASLSVLFSSLCNDLGVSDLAKATARVDLLPNPTSP